ncbi:hypothetical protein [Amycolatopsis jejuensis]|nr:hypothetical protein [Amycolatopsis jejuensis]
MAVPRADPSFSDIAAWPMTAPDNPAAWWMAGVLFVAGTAMYTAIGSCR